MNWLAGMLVSGIVKMYFLDGEACCCGCRSVCGTHVEVALECLESVGC